MWGTLARLSQELAATNELGKSTYVPSWTSASTDVKAGFGDENRRRVGRSEIDGHRRAERAAVVDEPGRV